MLLRQPPTADGHDPYPADWADGPQKQRLPELCYIAQGFAIYGVVSVHAYYRNVYNVE